MKAETTEKKTTKKGARKEPGKEKTPAKKAAKKEPGMSKTERWNVRFEECKQYRTDFGHCKVPISCKDKSLAIWVQEQRRKFKQIRTGKKARGTLTEEQIEKLDSIGFCWGWTPDPNMTAESDASWDANFATLQQYKERHGSCDIPMEADTLKLAKWASVQRNQYKKKKNKMKSFMTASREKKLKAIGFNWDGPLNIE